MLVFLILAIALLLFLSSPWNFVGFAVCLVGLGLVERDGLVVVGGLVVGSIGLTLSLGFVYAIFTGIETLI